MAAPNFCCGSWRCIQVDPRAIKAKCTANLHHLFISRSEHLSNLLHQTHGNIGNNNNDLVVIGPASVVDTIVVLLVLVVILVLVRVYY